MSLVYCLNGYIEAGCCACILSIWLQRGRLLYVYSVSMVTERQVAGRGSCHLYIVYMVTLRQVAVRVYCLYGYMEAGCCTCIVFL